MARRGSYAKGVLKREEILAAALTVIATQGYHSASVREIADAAGLSAPGMLHYFGTKEELFVAILRARDEQDEKDFAEHGVIDAFRGVMAHNASVPGLVQLYTQLAADAGNPDHPAHAYFRERTQHLEAASRDAVVAAQRAGELRPDLDPDWIVRTVHAVADGLQTAWLLDPSVDMTADVMRLLALLRP